MIRELSELSSPLLSFDPTCADQWERFGDGVRARLRLSSLVVFGAASVGGRAVTTFAYASGPALHLKRTLDEVVSTAGFVIIEPTVRTPSTLVRSWHALEAELERNPALASYASTRLRISSPELLAWLGARRETHDKPLDEDEAEVLRQLLPAIERRLVMDERLRRAPLALEALEAALRLFDEPVILADGAGEPVLLNASAQRRWEEGGFRALVARAASEGVAGAFRARDIAVQGLPRHVLLVHREGHPGAARAEQARRDWNLTPRETEVLGLVVQGQTNQAIADALGCAVRTIEIHITRLLQKSLADNRATLIARFWTGERP